MAKQQSKYEGENMIPYTLRIYPSLIERAKEKAGMVPLSTIIRALIEKWLSGEIVIDTTKRD
jgi:hypothetical protein